MLQWPISPSISYQFGLNFRSIVGVVCVSGMVGVVGAVLVVGVVICGKFVVIYCKALPQPFLYQFG